MERIQKLFELLAGISAEENARLARAKAIFADNSMDVSTYRSQPAGAINSGSVRKGRIVVARQMSTMNQQVLSIGPSACPKVAR
jgi:hypothetical protein